LSIRIAQNERTDAPLLWLRACGERPRSRADDKRDELAPFQSIGLYPVLYQPG
jgi:hypothetical protein